MKIFWVRHPTDNPLSPYYNWSFWCKQESCDKCNLRFLCFTNGKIVIIEDAELVRVLNDSRLSHNYNYDQRKARKVFFEYMGA